MATFEISITSVQQMPPITASVATVLIQFRVTGLKPDVVQVYAFNAAETSSKGLGDVVDTVDLNIPDIDYASSVQLQAGTYYTIALCPRNKTGESLDDQIDGQYWEAYCVATSIVTQATAQPQGQTPAPIITNLVPQAATISQDSSIIVDWQSSVTYNKFLIWWTENGIALQQGELDIQSSSGSWTASPTRPGATYTFSVKGGLTRGVSGYKYSDWGPTIKIVAPHNLTWLKQFLRLSGVDPSRQGLTTLMSHQTSVREFMKLA